MMREIHSASVGSTRAHFLRKLRISEQHGKRRAKLVTGDLNERLLHFVGFAKLQIGFFELIQKLTLLHDQIVALSGLSDDGLKLIGIPGLGDVTINVSLVDRLDHSADVGISGKEQASGLGVWALEA